MKIISDIINHFNAAGWFTQKGAPISTKETALDRAVIKALAPRPLTKAERVYEAYLDFDILAFAREYPRIGAKLVPLAMMFRLV